MKYCASIFLFALLTACSGGNKQTENKVETTKSDTIDIVNQIDPDSLIFEDFKKVFYEECKNWPVNFSIDSVRQQDTDYLTMLNDTNVVYHRSFRFTQPNDNYTNISVGYYRFSSLKRAKAVIENHCDEYKSIYNSHDGDDFDILLHYTKLPLYGFRIDSTIYVVNTTANIGHIVGKAVKTFKEKYNVNEDTDVIPCNIKFIEKEAANRIRPSLNRWLKHYSLNINDFINDGTTHLSLDSLNDKRNIYYQDFESEDDVYIPQLHDYSPNRRYYVNLLSAMYVEKGDDGRYHFRGSDDSQHLVLYDRNGKRAITISYRGLSNFVDGVFWVDNNTFIFAGYATYDTPGIFTVEVYDMQKDTISFYSLKDRTNNSAKESYMDVNMRSRGVVID